MASEYLKWKYRDVKPDEPPPSLRGWPKFKNWLYYNWKWIAVTAAALFAMVYLIMSILGIGKTRPDYTLAYVGRGALTEETKQTLISALQTLGEDVNGDGRIVIELQTYVMVDSLIDADSVEYNTAVSVRLLADLTAGDSVFFVTDDPEGLQMAYQILAGPDGTQPAEDDLSWEGKAIALGDLPTLNLGNETGLYIGRRWFKDEKQQDNKAADDALWAAIINGAVS